MSLLLRVKDIWRHTIQENAFRMMQDAHPDDEDWWEVVYMYIKCLTRHKNNPFPESYYQVLEQIRSTHYHTDNGQTIVCRFYATVTLGSLAEQCDDHLKAIQLYEEAEHLYDILTPEERQQQQVRAIPTHDTSFVALLSSTDMESVGTILDREMVRVRQQKTHCQEYLQQRQQMEQQAQQEEQYYHELAQNMSDDDDDDDNVPDDLLHLWQFPHRFEPIVEFTPELMEQVRPLPTHPKVKWLLRMVVDDEGVTYGQVYRVPQLKFVHEVAVPMSCALVYTYATACLHHRYQPCRLYVSGTKLDPHFLYQLALMGCTNVTEHP